ncbi:MAG: hypothetical protein EXR12_14905 [Rhodospirillaceae bacterium]|nr:hypothetical protein [Rhodospirillaceae bacterium]
MKLLVVAIAAVCALHAGCASAQPAPPFPPQRAVDDRTLVLNGQGERRVFPIGLVYLAALYVENRTASGEEVLRSPGPKLVELRFQTGLSESRVRTSFTDSLRSACPAPCQLTAQIDAFVLGFPRMNERDVVVLAFRTAGVDVTINGQPVD